MYGIVYTVSVRSTAYNYMHRIWITPTQKLAHNYIVDCAALRNDRRYLSQLKLNPAQERRTDEVVYSQCYLSTEVGISGQLF